VADISQQYRLHPEQWRAEAKRQTDLMMKANTTINTEKRSLDETANEGTILDAERKRQKPTSSE
jgi:hypothetical protein